jgi:hypothetical protein
VQNSSANTSFTVLDDRSTTIYGNTQFAISNGGQTNTSNALRFLLNAGTGQSYIDGWADGATKGTNYPIIFGSRVNQVGSNIANITTQENGSQCVFGFAVVDASAQLQINSTTRGFLPPQMTTAQRNAIASPANGLIVFDTDVQNLCYRRDSTWVQVSFTAV